MLLFFCKKVTFCKVGGFVLFFLCRELVMYLINRKSDKQSGEKTFCRLGKEAPRNIESTGGLSKTTGKALFGSTQKAARHVQSKHSPQGDAGRETERPFGQFIGSSAIMQRLYRSLRLLAGSSAPAFILGESGTGKELCAEALHQYSARFRGPFVAVNCAAIPKDLLESQLFGHLKGAFTGASCDRPGYALAAHEGTLFLDEVTELSLEMQSKLLRFLQTGQVMPVGASSPRKIDCRIVCASNVDPAEQVEQGKFREDLYYRLFVIPIELPPLSARGGDVVEIARALLLRYSAEEGRAFQHLSPAAEQALLDHSWPGNVRELENILRRAIVMHDEVVLTEAMLKLPVNAKSASSLTSPTASSALRPLWMVERDTIEMAIASCNGNIAQAAALLEVAPSTIYRKRLTWSM